MLLNPENYIPVQKQAHQKAKTCLEVNGLSKSFSGRGTILDDVSFQVHQGDAVALIGGNGSGKSTLLRCCLRLVEPDVGKITFLDEDLTAIGSKKLRCLRSRVGLVFQRHNLVPRLSVLTNVIHGAMSRTMGLRVCRQYFAPNHFREEAMSCLEKVGLAHLASSRADQLSGGESQRVAIARALMQKPDFMMADEPVASLDPKVGKEVMDLFIELIQKEKITLVYVSHDLDHALNYSTRLLALQKGRLVLNGEAREFTRKNLHEIYN